MRSYTGLIEEMALYLAEALEARECPCEALDSLRRCPSETRSAGGMDGRPATPTMLDGPQSLGWYEGFRLPCAVAPSAG